MAFITTGLTNGGVTTNFSFQYDSSLQKTSANPSGVEPARTNAVIAAAEGDLTLMKGWFGNSINVTGLTVQVTTQTGGASWSGSTSSATVTLKSGTNPDANFLRFLIVAEVTEIFMLGQNAGWFQGGDEGSKGEGLSRFLSVQFLQINGLINNGIQSGFDVADDWLNSSRQDFINNNPDDNAPDPTTGCTTLFIYYLFSQLSFTIPQIVAAAGSTMASVYTNLTGDSSDPFPFFKQLLDTAFPSTTSSAVPGPNQDNPFPLGMLSFWVDKSTYGKDEVTDVIAASSGTFSNAFWLVLEGFSVNSLAAVGATTPILSGPFKNLPGVSLTVHPTPEFESTANPKVPQRARFACDVTFANASLASFPASGSPPVEEVLNAVINLGASPLPGASASTEFQLIGGADPYFTNIDPAQNNVFYLSQDLRVFTATPTLNSTPVSGGPQFSDHSFNGAYSYVQNLLTFLNDPANHFTDGTADPFKNGAIPAQGGALSGDSSVTPFTFSGFTLHQNYNFAIARVRLRGTAGVSGEAPNVKVFFRMWATQTVDTDFQPSDTYLSHTVGGKPEWPLAAPGNHTIPFFATGNTPNLGDPNNSEYGTSGVNNQVVEIATGDTRWAYFGCFVNVYDSGNIVGGSPVQSLLAGTHHCLVAEIAYDGAPITNANGVTANPENNDKLAQRNLQITLSDNPGPAEAHRVPQTFDLRPSIAAATTPGSLLNYPDELMIDWGQTPAGSVASIYWPQINVSKVIDIANRLYGTHLLSQSDTSTLQCTVGKGVTYVPVPTGTPEHLAGLFTVDLPTTVKRGQEFNIVVRRISTRQAKGQTPPPPPPVPPQPRLAKKTRGKAASTQPLVIGSQGNNGYIMRNWRYVVGTFQVKIPVTTKEVMLRPDEDTLAIFKWRLGAIAPTNRWAPVLKRYISILSARITALGGNPDSIPPSLQGAPVEKPKSCAALEEFVGKVIEVIYDCFGEFEGFEIGDCCERRFFRSRERRIGEVVDHACRHGLYVTVFADRKEPHCIKKLVTRR
jgi:hypothetical protein